MRPHQAHQSPCIIRAILLKILKLINPVLAHDEYVLRAPAAYIHLPALFACLCARDSLFHGGALAHVLVMAFHMLMRLHLLLLMASKDRGSLGLTCQHLQQLLLQMLLCHCMLGLLALVHQTLLGQMRRP